METLSSQISSAIGIALSAVGTTESRHSAHLFLSQVKEANLETWQTCLSLFLELDSNGQKKWAAQERMFGVQVVGERSVIFSTSEHAGGGKGGYASHWVGLEA